LEKIGKTLKLVYFSFWLATLFASDANAYVDPATTTMLTQLIAGVFISLGIAFGIFRQKVSMFFQILKEKIFQNKIEKLKNEKIQ